MKTLARLAGSKTVLPQKVYRHELKYEIDYHNGRLIRRQMAAMLHRDENRGLDGSYIVKSLYFETPYNRDYTDKELGVQFRRKMRLRSYGDSPVYKIEIKEKNGDVATKYSVSLNKEQAWRISQGDYDCLVEINTAESLYIYHQLVTKVYRPLMTVCYRRYAFVQAAGNFRLTFDEDLRYSVSPKALFENSLPGGVVTDKTVIEIKYDDFVPNRITDILLQTGINAGESSKYAAAFRSIFD